jgi:hypothetical protein
MATDVMTIPGVMRATSLVESEVETEKQSLSIPSLRGRLVEIVVGGATPALSILSILIREAQQLLDPVVWLEAGTSIFYPPDFHENGVVLDAMPVIQTGTRDRAVRTAEHLIRADAFGMIVIDLEESGSLKPGRLGTLNRLAALHRVAVVFLNHCGAADEQSLGSLISLRIAVELEHPESNRFHAKIRALKDRRNPDGWVEEVVFRGTDGLY